MLLVSSENPSGMLAVLTIEDARTLCQRWREQHPEARCEILRSDSKRSLGYYGNFPRVDEDARNFVEGHKHDPRRPDPRAFPSISDRYGKQGRIGGSRRGAIHS